MEHVINTPDDLTDLDDPQAALTALDNAMAPLWQIRERLNTIANAVVQIDYINQNVSDALGRVPGALWRQPLGGHDAYPEGATVIDNDRLWLSERPANDRKPGTDNSGWTDQGPARDIPDPPDAEPWSPDAVKYTVNPLSIVTFDGTTYSCAQPHTSQADWTPAAVPALWTAIA